ncbi:MAG: hypothetical protein Q8P31_01110 [Bacillota bacterium]|nr:hypothetical protein [Bacillota bacterium]
MRVLPFASYVEGGGPTPRALEAATVLLTVESRRGKGTGFVLTRKATERVQWVSRLTWPMLAVPISLPAAASPEAGTTDASAPQPVRFVLFDQTGMIGSAIPPFQAREGLDDMPGFGTRLPVDDFILALGRQRDGFKQARKPLLGTLTNLVRRGATGDDITGFISGHKQLAQDLARHYGELPEPEWAGVELPRRLSAEEAERVAMEIDERVRAYLAQAGKVDEKARALSQEAETYPPELAQARDRIAANFNAQLEVLKPQVEEIVLGHQGNLEDRLTAISAQYSGTLASLEAELMKAQNEEGRFRDLGKEYEPQLADSRKAKQQAQRSLDAVTRERETTMRQARDHFRELINAENDKLNTLIKARDREVQSVRESEDKLRNVLKDLLAAAGSAAQRDREAAAELFGLTFEMAAPEHAGMVEFAVPVYAARLEGQRSRYVIIVPLALKRSRSVGQFVTGLIGAMTLPGEPRSPRYEQVLGRALASAFEASVPDAQSASVAAAVNEVAGDFNVLADPGYKALAMEGLGLLKEGKWLNDKQLAEQRQAIEGLYR